MKAVYKECSIDELGFIGRGKSKHRPRNDESLYGGKYPFIQTGDVKHSGLYITEYSQTYNDKGLAQSKLWEPGTLCITIAANIADTSILSLQACFPDSIIGFIPEEDPSDAKFVKYCIDALKLQIESISHGTTQDNLSLEKLRTIKFNVPQLPFRKKIAAVLSAYDDLIENNNRRIALLEKSAEELYKEWFVRMRFPGHESVKFEKGVPAGWEVKKLREIANVVMGQSPKSEFYNTNGEGLPFHQGVGTYGERFPKVETYSSEGKRFAKEGDILFSVRAPVGRLNIADQKLIIGRGLSAMSSTNDCNSYLFYLLRNAFSSEDIIGNGAIFTSVGKDELLGFEILYPGKDLVQKYDAITAVIDKQISTLLHSNNNLKTTRDRLLTRLISGKLTVEDLGVRFPKGMEG